MGRTLIVKVEPFVDFMSDALNDLQQFETSGELPDDPEIVSFDSAEDTVSLLTPKRLELLRSVMEAPPETQRALAEQLDRNPGEVSDDLQHLNEYGIIQYRKPTGRSKQPFCPYDEIHIDITLSI